MTQDIVARLREIIWSVTGCSDKLGALYFGVAAFLMVIQALMIQLGWHRRPK